MAKNRDGLDFGEERHSDTIIHLLQKSLDPQVQLVANEANHILESEEGSSEAVLQAMRRIIEAAEAIIRAHGFND